MIAAARRLEHIEIASYAVLRLWADYLQLCVAADLLAETLDEERRAEARPSEIADAPRARRPRVGVRG